MIELMLEAERAMGIGLIDNAERLYAQVVAADPHNSIAVTGLARVALERGDQRGAYAYARRALAIDPDNPVASHLAHRMAEQMEIRGETLPADSPAGRGAAAVDRAGGGASRAVGEPARTSQPAAGPAAASDAPAAPAVAPSPGLLARLLRRRR